MTYEEMIQEGEVYKQEQEAREPSLLSTAKAALSTTVTGASSFINMVDNKHMTPNNDGVDNYYETEEFKQTVDTMYPNISPSNLAELKDAKNQQYLTAKLRNQLKRDENIHTIENSGLTGMALEGAFSLADIPSWFVGGAAYKGGSAIKGILNLNRYGANTLANMANLSTSAAAAVGTSEALIQAEAGVVDTKRIEDMSQTAAVVGLALPLLGTVFTSTATGAGRQQLASNTNTLLSNMPGIKSLRGFLSLSSADQLQHASGGPMATEVGRRATTVVNARRDSNGNFITESEDTAMDYVDTTINREMMNLHNGTSYNSQTSGKSLTEQDFIDGTLFDNNSNHVEQDARGLIANTDEAILINEYKTATGTDFLDFEVQAAKAEKEATNLVDEATKQFELTQATINTQKAKRIETEVTNIVNTRVNNLEAEANILQTKTTSITNKIAELENTIQELQARSNIPGNLGIMPNKKDDNNLRKALISKDKLQTDLNSLTSKMEELNARNRDITTDELLLVQNKINKEFKSIQNQAKKGVTKAERMADELRSKVTKELPDDFYDVLTSVYKTKGFDSGRYQTPENVKYIEDTFVNFGKDATDVELKGIGGKDSRGYNHIKYNEEYMLSLSEEDAVGKLSEMLAADKLTQSLIARGEATMEDIIGEAKYLYNKALERDFKNKYLDAGKAGLATSASRKRRFRMDRSLHPDMFVHSVSLVGLEYADKVAGKIALKKTYGLDSNNLGQLSPVIDDYVKQVVNDSLAHGASAKVAKRDGDNTRAVLETVLGTRRMNKDPNTAINTTARMLKKGASALFSAGFVKYALVEHTVAVLRDGLPAVINNYVPAFKGLMEHTTNAKSNDPMVKVIRQAGLAVSIMRGMRYDRFDNMEITPTVSKSEMFLDKASHWARKISGFNFVNDWNDWLAGGTAMTVVNDIITTNRAFTRQEASRFARFGLSREEIQRIGTMDIKKSADGQVTDWNHDNWSDQELSKKFIRYVGRATRESVVRADGTRVHRWQSDVNNPLASLALQYTQMPVALYERILLNLGDEASARTVVGTIMAVGGMYSILALEDAALVASGAKDTRAGYQELLVKAAMNSPMAGIVPSFLDLGLAATGNKTLGGFVPKTDLMSVVGGAGYSVANRAFTAVSHLAADVSQGEASLKNVGELSKLAPIINSLVYTSAAMKGLQKDLKDGHGGSYDDPIYNYIK